VIYNNASLAESKEKRGSTKRMKKTVLFRIV